MAQGSRLRDMMILGENAIRTAASVAERTPWVSDRDEAKDGERSVPRTEASRAETMPWHEFRGGNGDGDGRSARRTLPRFELPPREEVDVDEGAEPRPERHSTALVPVRTKEPTPAQGWRARRPWLIVAGLTIAGLVIRLVLMRSIWVDEAISIHQAHMSLGDMLNNLRATDRHPPFHYLVLWATVRLFGDGELAVRAPSILATTALIPMLFVTGRELFDRRTGLVAAGLATTAPLIVWYGQEARMYALFMLFGVIALWAQARILRDGRTRYWVIYAAVTIALLYTHYFALIPIAIQQVVFAVAAWKRASAGQPVRNLLTGCWLTWLALLVAAAPLAPFAYDQFSHSQAAGMGFGGAPSAGTPLSIPGSSASLYAILSNVVWAIWGYHANSTMVRIAALWPLLMLLSLALMGQRRSSATRVVLALALGPVLILLFVGLVKRDLFEVRYFIGAVPMMMLLLARSVAGRARRRLPALIATGALAGSMLLALADQQLNPNNPRDFDFKGALARVQSQARPGDTLIYAPEYLRDVVSYYLPGIHAEALSDVHRMPTRGRVFLLGSFLDDPGTAQALGSARYELGQKPRHLIDSDNLKRIHIWEYSS
jgi:Dolichyl-phosphate-mannose-protein mannosyltransferase